jgi:plastocyanin
MRKSFAAVSSVLVVLIIIIAVVIVSGSAFYLMSRSSTTVQTQQTTTNSANSSSVSTIQSQQTSLTSSSSATSSNTSTSSSSSIASGKLLIEFTFPGTIVVSPDLASMNYSLTLQALGNVPANLDLQVIAPQGLTAAMSPSNVTLTGAEAQATLQVSSSSTLVPGNYQLVLEATSGGSTYSENATIQVLKYLVVTIGTSFVPQNLTITQGSSVTWLRLNGAISQYDNGAHDVDFSTGISLVSPTLDQYQSWSMSFNQTGDYMYYCKYHPFMLGQIIVTS